VIRLNVSVILNCYFCVSALLKPTMTLTASAVKLFRPLVICGPSGSGKSTILKRVMNSEAVKEYLAFSVSHTTRQPRKGEQDGKDYHFVSHDNFNRSVSENAFVEHAEFSGNQYGTSKESIRRCQLSGKLCVLDIDSQGVRSLKKTDLNPFYVFILPPSLEELERRLRGRRTESEESLQRRLSTAKSEVTFGQTPGNFDETIINDDLDRAVEKLHSIVLKLIAD